MKSFKWLFVFPLVVITSIAIFGCARGASEATIVTGYTETGARLTAKAAGSGELCSATVIASGSYFAARCEDSGLKVFNTADCSVICSGPVDL